MRCDNYNTCGSETLYVQPIEVWAKGWHLFTGLSMSGKPMNVTLCPKCTDAGRRRLPSVSEPLEGQEPLEGLDEVEKTAPPVPRRKNRRVV
jgi:hypothetical protein